MTTLIAVLMFLCIWGLTFCVLMLLAIAFVMAADWRGETPNIAYAYLIVLALLLTIAMFALNLLPPPSAALS